MKILEIGLGVAVEKFMRWPLLASWALPLMQKAITQEQMDFMLTLRV